MAAIPYKILYIGSDVNRSNLFKTALDAQIVRHNNFEAFPSLENRILRSVNNLTTGRYEAVGIGDIPPTKYDLCVIVLNSPPGDIPILDIGAIHKKTESGKCPNYWEEGLELISRIRSGGVNRKIPIYAVAVIDSRDTPFPMDIATKSRRAGARYFFQIENENDYGILAEKVVETLMKKIAMELILDYIKSGIGYLQGLLPKSMPKAHIRKIRKNNAA